MPVLTPPLVGGFAHCISQMLIKTLSVTVSMHPSVDPTGQYAYGFWHDKQFMPIMMLASMGNRRHAGLVSTSGDGEMLANWLNRLGYFVVRGSSSKKAISGLVRLLGAAKEGYSVGIAADGPRGPRHVAKAGLSFLAHKAGIDLVPLGVAYSAKWQFHKSWDKYQLPLPFAKSVFHFGEPINIFDMADPNALNEVIGQAINAAETEAGKILQTM